jgi:hypothetical protein
MARNFMNIRKGISFIGNLSADPSGAREGDFYFNTSFGALKTFRGGRWIAVEEAELIRLARIEEDSPTGDRAIITAAEQILPLGQVITLELSGLRLTFDGAEIDFVTGEIFEDDGSTPLGIDFTPSLPTGTNWRWHSVTLIPSTVNADQTINAQLIVIPADTEAATKALAEKPGLASSGKPLGFVAVQGDGGGGINPITFADIDQIAPGGTGGGIGDITDIQTRIDDAHDDSFFDLQTPLVFKIVEDDLTESGTASFSIVDGAYEFSAAQDLLTTDLIDYTEFNNNGAQDIGEIDLLMFQNLSTVDTAFTAEATRDGVNFRDVGMTRVGNTDLWRGNIKWEDDRAIADIATLIENDVAGDGSDDIDNILDRYSQSFSLTDDSFITSITLALFVDTGAPTGDFFLDISEDNGSNEPGITVATSDPFDISAVSGTTLDDVFTFPTEPLLNGSQTYFWKIRPATDAVLDGSNFIGVQRDSGDPFAGGNVVTSADGELSWSQVAGTDAVFRVTGKSAPEYFETLDEQTSTGSSIVLNATTVQEIGQEFDIADFLSLTGTTKDAVIKRVTLKVTKTEAVSGNLDGGVIRVSVRPDDGGDPSTDVATTALDLFIDDLSGGANDVVFDFDDYPLEINGDFHIVVSTNQIYKDAFSAGVDEIAIETFGTPSIAAQTFNGTVWATDTDEAYFVLEGKQVELQVRVTASTDMLLNALAVLYDKEVAGFAGASRERQRFVFDGSANKIDFEITNFTPDVDRLFMCDPDTGQAFIAGGTQGFNLDGRFVTFAVDSGGDGPFTEDRVYTIEARQVPGGSIDDSQGNLALLAANHLGSEDEGIDRSVPGRGIILRADDGIQYELVIKTGGSGIQIFEVT